jgi:MFS transporter, DHA1 family, multidrug resistance protein
VQDRGWRSGPAGLPFIAVGIGMLFGMAGTVYDSMLYGKKLSKAGGPLAPEERLRGACVGGVLLPISLAWFAASAKPSVHWLAPTIAGGLFGCSMLLIFMGGTAYLVDTYLTVAASAMAANSFMRSLL